MFEEAWEMRGAFTTLVWIATILSIFALYAIKSDTRQLEVRVREMERQVNRTGDEIANLQAQWSELTKPERVEQLARKHLNYGPLRPRQFATLDEIERAAREVSDK